MLGLGALDADWRGVDGAARAGEVLRPRVPPGRAASPRRSPGCSAPGRAAACAAVRSGRGRIQGLVELRLRGDQLGHARPGGRSAAPATSLFAPPTCSPLEGGCARGAASTRGAHGAWAATSRCGGERSRWRTLLARHVEAAVRCVAAEAAARRVAAGATGRPAHGHLLQAGLDDLQVPRRGDTSSPAAVTSGLAAPGRACASLSVPRAGRPAPAAARPRRGHVAIGRV